MNDTRSTSYQTNSCPLGTCGKSCMATLQRDEKESHFPQVFLELDNLQFSECWYLWLFPDLLWPTLNKEALTDQILRQCSALAESQGSSNL